jgi:hypothetical protein
VVGCCECSDEPLGSAATELVRINMQPYITHILLSIVNHHLLVFYLFNNYLLD